MEAKKSTINDIFNGNRILEIPFFQRSYIWDEPQWQRFIDDLEYVSHNNSPYFLGSVILKQQLTDSQQSTGDRRTLIDGQQRLTTLNIFFKVYSLKTGNTYLSNLFRLPINNNQIALLHNRNDIQAFNTIMDLTAEVELSGKDNITRAYTYFSQNMDTTNLNFQNILTKIMFVGIDLGLEDDEQQIFDTTNSLGVDLTTADLLKNYFFSRNEIASYIDKWQSVFELDKEIKDFWDTEIVTGRLRREFIDLFFYSFLQIKIQDDTLNIKTEDKIEFTKAVGLFNSYKKFITNYSIDKNALISEIKEYAILFQNNFDNEIIYSELPAESGIERINAIIWGLENTTLIPYVLYILKNVNDVEKRNNIFDYLESYIMRRMVCHANTKNYNQLFSESLISNKLLSKTDLKNFIDSKADKVNYMPSNVDLLEGFHNSKLVNKQSAGILYFIETKIRDRARHSSSVLGIDRYSLEHIMPKKWENKWDSVTTEDEKNYRNRKLLTLGNLTILTNQLNASIRDNDWSTKKTGRGNKLGLNQYASGLDTFSQYLVSPVWDEAKIEERANFLFNEAIKIWST